MNTKAIYKLKSTGGGTTAGSYIPYHWDATSHTWVTGTTQPLQSINLPFGTTSYGAPSFSFPHMQEYLKDEYSMSYAEGQHGLASSGQDVFIHAGLGQAIRVDRSDLLGLATKGRLLNGLVPTGWDLYAKFGSTYQEPMLITSDPFESEFSIWFLVVDLVELPKLALGVLKALRAYKRLAKSLPFSATAQVASNSYLAFQFGLKPSLADLREFISLFVKWSKYSAENPSFLRTFQKRDRFPILAPDYARTGRVAFANVDIPIHTSAQFQHGMLYRSLEYYFICPELSGILNRMRQLVDLLGVLDPAAIWDAIPFSFLLDWVFPVGKWLHNNLKPRLFPADLVFADYCESNKRHFQVLVTAEIPQPDPSGPGLLGTFTESICSGTYTSYLRRRKFPKIPPVDRSKIGRGTIVTVKQALIGSALTAQGLTKNLNHLVKRLGKSPRYRKRRSKYGH